MSHLFSIVIFSKFPYSALNLYQSFYYLLLISTLSSKQELIFQLLYCKQTSDDSTGRIQEGLAISRSHTAYRLSCVRATLSFSGVGTVTKTKTKTKIAIKAPRECGIADFLPYSVFNMKGAVFIFSLVLVQSFCDPIQQRDCSSKLTVWLKVWPARLVYGLTELCA